MEDLKIIDERLNRLQIEQNALQVRREDITKETQNLEVEEEYIDTNIQNAKYVGKRNSKKNIKKRYRVDFLLRRILAFLFIGCSILAMLSSLKSYIGFFAGFSCVALISLTQWVIMTIQMHTMLYPLQVSERDILEVENWERQKNKVKEKRLALHNELQTIDVKLKQLQMEIASLNYKRNAIITHQNGCALNGIPNDISMVNIHTIQNKTRGQFHI